MSVISLLHRIFCDPAVENMKTPNSAFPPEFSLSAELVDKFNSDNSISPLLSGSAMQELIEIRRALHDYGFSVIRKNKHGIPALIMMKSLGARLFIDEYGRNEITLQASPFETNNAETLYEGRFHTDFSTLTNPPDFVLLECIEPDARHPLYGRNQVVNLAFLIRKLDAIDKSLAQLFVNTSLPFSMRRGFFWSRPVRHSREIGAYIQYHPGYLSKDHLDERHEFIGVPIHHLVEEIALDTAYDFCLGKGDILVVSNKKCLHRRGRTTACFGSSVKFTSGRIVRTTRYYMAHGTHHA